MDNQNQTTGKTLALLIFYSLCWEEPLNGDDIEEISGSFKDELKQLCGET